MRARCVRLLRENRTTAGQHNGGRAMRTGAGRIVACCVVVCVLAATGSCFGVRTEAAEPFAGGEPPGDDDRSDHRVPAAAADPVSPHCKDMDGDRQQPGRFLGIDWRRAGSGMADHHWWIVAVSSLLSLAVLWRIQCNARRKLQQWKRLPPQKDTKAYSCSRRLTLPDLTLAKHARRESLAEASLKSPNHPRKMSQCNGSSQIRSVKHNLFERNDDALAETKRVHKIRRRH